MIYIKRLLYFVGNTIFIFFVSVFFKTSILENCLGKVLVNRDEFISLVYVKNNGAAFNMFAGHVDLLVIIAAIILIYCMFYVFTYKFYISESFLFLMSMFCGGIVGNAYERIVFGFVTDYIKINLFDFPVFNINDIFITVGAVLLSLVLICDKYREIQEIKDVEEDDLYRDLL